MNRSISKLAPIALLAGALLTPSTAPAQDHPALERGFAAEKVYDFSGLDSVNLFNGNLTLTIPLGQTYKGNGALSYGFSLVYNSNVWQFQQRHEGPQNQIVYTQAQPVASNNAGMGFTVSMGELVPPTRPGNETPYWVYVSPDGAEHTLYPTLHHGTSVPGGCYSRDGSYLRMRGPTAGFNCSSAGGTTFWIDFPDGTSHRFSRGTASGNPPLKLDRIEDSFGNFVTVNQGASVWTINDGIRTHYVRFTTRPASGMKVVTEVDLAGFNGQRAKYAFDYGTDETISRSCKHTDPNLPPTVTVSFLRSVTLPDGAGWWLMNAGDNYHTACTAPGSSVQIDDLPGVIRKIRLPTRGQIEWDWQLYGYPVRDVQARESLVFGSSVGVKKKKLLEANGTGYDVGSNEWTYTWERVCGNGGSPPCPVPPWERKTVVRDPMGNDTVHYFDDNPNRVGSGWNATGWEYGLPFKKTSAIDGQTRFLSRQIFDGPATGAPERSIYVAYDHSNLPSPTAPGGYTADTWMNSNRRMTSEKIFYDDGTWASTDYSSFDGLGHFRTVSTDGHNFLRGNERTETTNYNPGRTYPGNFSMPPYRNGNAGRWNLGLYTHVVTSEVESEIGSPSFRQEFDFDFDFSTYAGTGFLQCKRTVTSGTPTLRSDDVVTIFAKNAAGNMTSESWYGGDRQNVGIGSTCSAASTWTYRTEYDWSNGAIASSRNKAANGVLEPHFNFERTIDTNTGLTRLEYDSSGYKTRFTHDLLGRMTLAEPLGNASSEAAAMTEYGYSRAVGDIPAKVFVKVKCPSGIGCSTVYAEKEYWFDALGRLTMERVLLPNGTWAWRETLHNPIGWKRKQSEWGPGEANLHYTEYYGFDPFGRPGRIVPPDGAAHEINLEYFGVSRIQRTVKIGLGLGGGETAVSSSEYYDRQGRLARVDENSGPGGENSRSQYWHDAMGRLRKVRLIDTSVVPDFFQERYFNYDGRGFLLSESHPEKTGSVVYRDYDAKGHAWEVQDGGTDRKLGYVFDASERLTRVSELGGRVLKEFTYDRSTTSPNLGKLLEAVRHNYVWGPSFDQDVKVTETYSYGSYGRRVIHRSTQINVAGANQERFEQGWTYDRAGQVTQIQYPQGFGGIFGSGTPGRTVGQTWTNGFQTGAGGVASMTYHPNGMVASIVHGNGVRVTIDNDGVDMRRPASITVKNSSGAVLWASGGYSYDGAGNIKQIGADKFRYDKVSRVREAQLDVGGVTRNQSYGYDTYGSIQWISTDGTTIQTTTSKATNRLASHTYDNAGNLLHWNGQSYWYDRLNKMNRYCSTWGITLGSDEDGGDIPTPPTGCTGEYWLSIYTADDERIWFRRVDGAFQKFTVRDLGANVLRRFDNANYWLDYIYRNGQVVATVNPSGAVANYHLDHLGTPRYITNPSQAKISEHEYFPYGQEATLPQIAEPTRFTGHERDMLTTWQNPEDDLDYMHARFQSPILGRFTSTDPSRRSVRVKIPQSFNRYTYALSNPMRLVDPNGREPLTVTATVLAVAQRVAVGAAVGVGVRLLINEGIRATVKPDYPRSTGLVGAAVSGGVSGGAAPTTFGATLIVTSLGSGAGRLVDDLVNGVPVQKALENSVDALKTGLVGGLVQNAAVSRLAIGDLGSLGTTVAGGVTASLSEAASEALPLLDELEQEGGPDEARGRPRQQTCPEEGAGCSDATSGRAQ
ncbi:MAG: hypothetical protein AMXMBFR36_26660 [Acidobacteriota bacterium]